MFFCFLIHSLARGTCQDYFLTMLIVFASVVIDNSKKPLQKPVIAMGSGYNNNIVALQSAGIGWVSLGLMFFFCERLLVVLKNDQSVVFESETGLSRNNVQFRENCFWSNRMTSLQSLRV